MFEASLEVNRSQYKWAEITFLSTQDERSPGQTEREQLVLVAPAVAGSTGAGVTLHGARVRASLAGIRPTTG